MTYCVACGIETKEMFCDSCQREREQAQQNWQPFGDQVSRRKI